MKKETLEMETLLEFEKKRHIIGVKFLRDQSEYDHETVREATHQMFFCMMVKAAVTGHSMKVKKEHIYCSTASEILGFSEPEEETLSGEIWWKRKMYCSKETAGDIAGETPWLRYGVYGMVLRPLECFQTKPDVVMCFCKPYTAMRIIQGYSYQYGLAKQIRFSGMSAICTELMAKAYKTQDISVSLLCSGTRFAGEWKDDEMGLAFPYSMFSDILDGVKKTMNIFEPDDKKEKIIERSLKNNIEENVQLGDNYHKSSLGVAKMGVTGYYPKPRTKKRYEGVHEHESNDIKRKDG